RTGVFPSGARRRGRPPVSHLEVPHDGHQRGTERWAAHRRRRPAYHASWTLVAAHQTRRIAAAAERVVWGDVSGGAASRSAEIRLVLRCRGTPRSLVDAWHHRSGVAGVLR